MRKIVIFSYNVNDSRLSKTNNMIKYREIQNIGGKDEKEMNYAKSTKPDNKANILIAPYPEKVYYNESNETYNVWFDDPGPVNEYAANILFNYISTQFNDEIEKLETLIEFYKNRKEKLNKSMEYYW